MGHYENDLKRNNEGYPDPTAYEAITNASIEAQADADRFHKLLYAIFDICELSGFYIKGRITLVDTKTGKVWR